MLILAFVTGATLARLAVAFGQRRNVRTVFCLVMMCEGALLLATSLVEIRWYSVRNNGEVLFTLALLMVLHNATSMQLSGGRVMSTHVTGTLTDAGMALGSLLRASVSRREAADAPAHRALLGTHLVTIVSFLSGCLAGYSLFVRFGFSAMAGLTGLLILTALGGITPRCIAPDGVSGSGRHIQRLRSLADNPPRPFLTLDPRTAASDD